jgi:hypothetical protein
MIVPAVVLFPRGGLEVAFGENDHGQERPDGRSPLTPFLSHNRLHPQVTVRDAAKKAGELSA